MGVVTGYDDARGLGTVSEGATGGGVTWPFHCTAITDGSRTVEAGERVAFEVRPGHLGRMWATRVTKLAR